MQKYSQLGVYGLLITIGFMSSWLPLQSATVDPIAAEAPAADGAAASPVVPLEKAYRRLILLLDPHNWDSNNGALTQGLKLALSEKSAPIITSGRILKNFITDLKTTWPEPHLSDLLNDTDWMVTINKHADIVLLIPRAHLEQVSGRGLIGRRRYGFKILPDSATHLYANDIIRDPSTIDIARPESWDFMRAFKSMFDTSKTNLCWNIYLFGHGGLVGRDATGKIDEKTAAIAGLYFEDFKNLITFFNGGTNNIQASFLFYTTCFGGGINQTLINNVLKKLDAKFIVAAYGLNDYFTYANSSCSLTIPLIQDSSTGKWIVKTKQSFTNFFNLLADFFQPGTASRSTAPKQKAKDPLKTILQQLSSDDFLIKNQPSVRIPSAGVFSALSVDSKVKVLTSSIVKAAEQTNTEINLRLATPRPEFLLVYPERIGVSLKIGRGQGIIVPANAQQKVEKPYHLRIFEQIDCGDLSLNQFLCNMCLYNHMDAPIVFLVKKLQCQYARQDNQFLENVILQIAPLYKPGVQWIDSFSISLFFAYEGKTYNAHIPLAKALDVSDRSKDISTKNADHEKAINEADFDERSNNGLILHAKTFLCTKPQNDLKKPTACETLQAIFDTFDDTVEKTTIGGLAENNNGNRLEKLLTQLEKAVPEIDQANKNRILSMLDGMLDQSRNFYATGTITLASKHNFTDRISALRGALGSANSDEETAAIQREKDLDTALDKHTLLKAFNTQSIKQKTINKLTLDDINLMLQLFNLPASEDGKRNIPDQTILNDRLSQIMLAIDLTSMPPQIQKTYAGLKQKYLSVLATAKRLLLQQHNVNYWRSKIHNLTLVYSVSLQRRKDVSQYAEEMRTAIQRAIDQGFAQAVNTQLQYLEHGNPSFAPGYAEYKRLYAELTASLPTAEDLKKAILSKPPNVERVREIVRQNPASVNQFDSNGFTPLYRACQFKNIEAATLLLEAGANPNIIEMIQKSVLELRKQAPGTSPENALLIELLERYSN